MVVMLDSFGSSEGRSGPLPQGRGGREPRSIYPADHNMCKVWRETLSATDELKSRGLRSRIYSDNNLDPNQTFAGAR